MNARIRKAVASDATAIAIVQAYTWLTTYRGLLPDDVLEARVNAVPKQAAYLDAQISEGKSYYVADVQGTVVGFAACSLSRDENYPDDAEVQAVYLLKGYQGNGIGSELFTRCARAFSEQGFTNMIVNCLDGNPSMKFYLKMGGECVGVREDVISGGLKIREHVLRFKIEEVIERGSR